MRSILVPVADRPECATALDAAFTLANQLGANITGCHIRPHDAEQALAMEQAMLGMYAFSDWQSALSEKTIRLNSKAAKSLFDTWVAAHEFTAAKSPRFQPDGHLAVWNEMKGSPGKIMSIVGPICDLIVVSRPSKKTSERARSFLMAALMQSGKPVLMLPARPPKKIGKRVLIAWNQSTEAAAAVTAALPILRDAESVRIVTCGKENRLGPQARYLQQYLRFWNVKTSLERTPGKSPRDEILTCFADTKSDLLVMGAYSRPKWREVIFGGLTQHMLTKSKIPVFMLHR